MATDVGNEAESCRQDAPKDRAWNPDEPQTYPDHHAKCAVQDELSQEQPAKAARRVVERRRRTLEIG